MTGSVPENLKLFASLCGQSAIRNAIIATTMWDKVTKHEQEQREVELLFEGHSCQRLRLQDRAFREHIRVSLGCRGEDNAEEFGHTFAIQVEMNDGVPFHKTSAAAHATESTQEV